MSSATEIDVDSPAGAASALRSTRAVRARARFLMERARAGESPWFTVHADALEAAAALVAEVTRSSYPDLQIPFHSRWRHFEAGGVDRKELLTGADAAALVDLTVVSVLLDAGAGPSWSYLEPGTSLRLSRSEGLGVASFHAFTAGLFSSEPDDPLRVDAAGLAGLTAQGLAEAFQAGDTNPLVGLDGRVAILRRLGAALAAAPEVFGADGRPGGLLDTLGTAATVPAHDVLTVILTALAPIWPGGSMIGDQPLGDCWRHRALRGPGLTAGWMPFHKLSQWLTYSLLEPFGWAGIQVTDLDELTGLPEYRNGGLLIDAGVLSLRDPGSATRTLTAADELVVEWRALTVALLDELAPLVRAQLGVTADELPLARILQGGTWAAGRQLAQQLRGGLPPLSIVSDGTVF